MQTKPCLTFDDAERMAAAARIHALARQWPVTICICDDGGHVLLLNRLDRATALSARVALAKCVTAALSRRETRHFQEMINGGNTAFITAPAQALIEGGVPIMVGEHVVGAIGVSGVKSPEDAEIARIGIAALHESMAHAAAMS